MEKHGGRPTTPGEEPGMTQDPPAPDTPSDARSLAEPGLASLRRFFYDGFTASDLAEPLISWDAEQPATRIRSLMEERCLRLAGVRRHGLVTDFVLREELTGGTCGECASPFEPHHLIEPRAPLHEVVTALADHDGLFLAPFGSVAGIITRTDLEKPQGRMWLFGLLTVVETAITESLRTSFPGEGWQVLLSPGRLQRAQNLQEERSRMGDHSDLLDCLQFGDKCYALFKDAAIREQFGFSSRQRARQVTRDIERLRNALAHTQPLVPGHWDTIERFAAALDRILALYHRPRSRFCGGNLPFEPSGVT